VELEGLPLGTRRWGGFSRRRWRWSRGWCVVGSFRNDRLHPPPDRRGAV